MGAFLSEGDPGTDDAKSCPRPDSRIRCWDRRLKKPTFLHCFFPQINGYVKKEGEPAALAISPQASSPPALPRAEPPKGLRTAYPVLQWGGSGHKNPLTMLLWTCLLER